jgi:hypothetical protein
MMMPSIECQIEALDLALAHLRKLADSIEIDFASYANAIETLEAMHLDLNSARRPAGQQFAHVPYEPL